MLPIFLSNLSTSSNNGLSRALRPSFFGGAFELELIIVTQLASNHRVELRGQLLAFGGPALQSFVHAHSLAGRSKLADGQVGGITNCGVLLYWRRLHEDIVDTQGLRGRKRANRGAHGPSWPGL